MSCLAGPSVFIWPWRFSRFHTGQVHVYIICRAWPNGGNLHLKKKWSPEGSMEQCCPRRSWMSKNEKSCFGYSLYNFCIYNIHINLCVHVCKTWNAWTNVQVSAKKLSIGSIPKKYHWIFFPWQIALNFFHPWKIFWQTCWESLSLHLGMPTSSFIELCWRRKHF